MKPRSSLSITLMSQFLKDPRETWITGIGIVSSLGDGRGNLGTLFTRVA